MSNIGKGRGRDESGDHDRLKDLEDLVRDHERILRGEKGENGMVRRVKVLERWGARIGGAVVGVTTVAAILMWILDCWPKVMALFRGSAAP